MGQVFSNVYDKFFQFVCITITEGKIGLKTEMKTDGLEGRLKRFVTNLLIAPAYH